MAEIHIQEKKRRTVWPWLLLLLIPLLWLGLRDREVNRRRQRDANRSGLEQIDCDPGIGQ